MGDRLIGACTDDFQLPAKQALEACARTGFRAVEIGAAGQEINPRALTESGRQHLLRICRGLGVSPVGLTIAPSGPGWSDPAVLDARVQQAVETLELASQLRLPVVSARLGPLLDADGRASQQTMEAIQLVAARADQMGVSFAVETGPDEPGVLAERLRELACPSLGVCLDPAGLVQFGYDPGEAASRFAELIGLSRVADAYAGGRGRPGAETALGQGQLDLAGYLAHLAGGDYCGPLILRRRQSLNPTSELQAGLALLQQALA